MLGTSYVVKAEETIQVGHLIVSRDVNSTYIEDINREEFVEIIADDDEYTSGIITDTNGVYYFFRDSLGNVYIDGELVIERVDLPYVSSSYGWTYFNIFRTRQSYYSVMSGIGLSALLMLILGWQGAAISFVASTTHTLYTSFGQTELYLEIVQYHSRDYTKIKEIVNAFRYSNYTGLVNSMT